MTPNQRDNALAAVILAALAIPYTLTHPREVPKTWKRGARENWTNEREPWT